MGRRIDADSFICSLDYRGCDGLAVHNLSQRRLTAEILAPLGSDYSQMRSKVSSDWLPSYIKVVRRVLELLKMTGYFLDRPRIFAHFG